MLKLARLVASLLVLLAVTETAAFAQTGTSGISGTVRDSTGAVVPNATVTAMNEATGLTYTQSTTDSGLFAFTSLPVGNYTITIEKQGFKKFQKTHNALEVGTPLAVDAAMEVGQLSEVVTVQGGIEQLQTSTATI